MKKIIALLFVTFFVSCKSTKKKDFEGNWLINKLIYNGNLIEPYSHSLKVNIIPVGYEGKEIMTFDIENSTCRLPGINSEDVLLKCTLQQSILSLNYDSSLFYNLILKDVEKPVKPFYKLTDKELLNFRADSLRYEKQRDSILVSQALQDQFNAIKIYSGNYEILKNNKKELILKSKTTQIKLLNNKFLMEQRIDELMQQIQ